jgi:hypothetical protein
MEVLQCRRGSSHIEEPGIVLEVGLKYGCTILEERTLGTFEGDLKIALGELSDRDEIEGQVRNVQDVAEVYNLTKVIEEFASALRGNLQGTSVRCKDSKRV